MNAPHSLVRAGLMLFAMAAAALFDPAPHNAGAVGWLPPSGPHPAGTGAVSALPARKICQVMGEVDRETGQTAINRTVTRHRFWGTDLGASFEHRGRLYFLFGDTHTSGGLRRPVDSDFIAVSDDRDPEDCLAVDVASEADGGFRPLTIPGVHLGPFAVPTGGFSVDGRMYVFATTDHTPANPMGRSVLARSTDDGWSFEHRRDMSRTHFINVAPVVADARTAGAVPGLLDGGPMVLLWGSGRYRASDPRFAIVPADRVEERDAIRYFAGVDGATGEPRWSAREEDSAPLFHQPCLGELSVAHLAPLGKWAMLYNCAEPGNRILIRTADRPWGPWSEPSVLVDPERDGAFCRYMHPGPLMRVRADGCRMVSDPHSIGTAGDVYAPYIVSRFTRANPDGSADIYFLMSTWNPYTVVLMKATLRPDSPHPPAMPGSRLAETGAGIPAN